MRLIRLLPRFQRAYRELERLADRETWSRADLDSFQLERLNAVWQHAIAYVPYYRRLSGERGLPGRFSSLEEYTASVPLLRKREVRAQREDFFSRRAQPGSWRRTGGSTGAPMSTYWAKEAHLEMLRAKYRYLARWGVDIFDRTAFLWGHSASLAPGMAGRVARVRIPVEDRLRNRIRLSAYHLGHDDLRGYLEQIRAFRPVSMYGYSRALYLLALEAEALDFRSDGIRLFTLTGEPASPFIVETIERVFGAPAAVEYGSIECGAVAAEWPDRALRVNEDVVLLETVARADGRYDIVASVLNNPSYPLLRYAIADLTDAELERPDRGFAVLKNVAGRDNDFVLTRSGGYLHSSRFDALFKYGSRAIRRFRVQQQADGSLSVVLEISGGSELDRAAMEQKIRDLVEGYPVRLEVVESIEQTPAGKHRLVISHLVHPAGGSPAGKSGGNGPTGRGGNGAQSPAPPAAGDAETAATAAPDVSTACPPAVPRRKAAASSPATPSPAPRKTTLLRRLIQSPELSYIMEAHNGLSARIVEEAGFEAIWASGLAISASLGVRDSNEASWTQVVDVLEFMSDATRLPILADGDTGYGNFNNVRRLVRKLEQRGVAGLCIEDKVFPKANSFLGGRPQPLAGVEEFAGRICAGKDAQTCDDFVIVARVEAFIAGRDLEEALRRAEVYHKAGADAILIHSARHTPDEVIAFKQRWGDRSPVVIVPTKYFSTPTEIFRRHGFSAVIWANHLMRSCITAMQGTARHIFESRSLTDVESRVASLAEVFRLQNAAELAAAERRYLPHRDGPVGDSPDGADDGDLFLQGGLGL